MLQQVTIINKMLNFCDIEEDHENRDLNQTFETKFEKVNHYIKLKVLKKNICENNIEEALSYLCLS